MLIFIYLGSFDKGGSYAQEVLQNRIRAPR